MFYNFLWHYNAPPTGGGFWRLLDCRRRSHAFLRTILSCYMDIFSYIYSVTIYSMGNSLSEISPIRPLVSYFPRWSLNILWTRYLKKPLLQSTRYLMGSLYAPTT